MTMLSTRAQPRSSGSDAVIQTFDLTKQFGEEFAVQRATFDVPRGAIFGFIGPSGSGKTTMVRLLTGVLTPTGGTARVLGKEPIHFNQATRERIGYMPQLFVLYPQLTVWENLNFAASIYGMGLRRGARLREMLEFVELYDHRFKLVRNISGGMQRRLSLAATLAHAPELVFLDEPTAGIDPILRSKFWDHFRALRDRGRTLFVTTQYVGEAAYCDQVAVMVEGRLLMVETPENLRHRAFGGAVINLTLSREWDRATLRTLRTLPFVSGPVNAVTDRQVRLVVDDASTALPALIDWCRGQSIEIQSAEEYKPPYDDVFVELVKDHISNGEGRGRE